MERADLPSAILHHHCPNAKEMIVSKKKWPFKLPDTGAPKPPKSPEPIRPPKPVDKVPGPDPLRKLRSRRKGR